MTIHISIDIETASTKKNAAITQIGVAVMESDGTIREDLGRNFKVDITCYNRLPMFDVDIGTMMWWATQDKVAFNAAFGAYNPTGMEGVNEDREDLETCLALLSLHLNEIEGKKRRIWAKPPSFDLLIIQNALERSEEHTSELQSH